MSERVELPTLRHPDCEVAPCETCLRDHLALADYLYQETGADRRHHDIGGEYVTWLERNSIPAQTEHGWGTSESFREDVVARFVSEWEVF